MALIALRSPDGTSISRIALPIGISGSASSR